MLRPRVADDVSEILHRANQVLLEEHRSRQKSGRGLSLLIRVLGQELAHAAVFGRISASDLRGLFGVRGRTDMAGPVGMRHPRPSLFSSVTCEPTCVRGPYPPEGHDGSKQMRLQVLAIMENGASKIIPKGSDTLRVLLILRAPEGSPSSESPESQRGSPPSPIRRRVMRSLVAGS